MRGCRACRGRPSATSSTRRARGREASAARRAWRGQIEAVSGRPASTPTCSRNCSSRARLTGRAGERRSRGRVGLRRSAETARASSAMRVELEASERLTRRSAGRPLPRLLAAGARWTRASIRKSLRRPGLPRGCLGRSRARTGRGAYHRASAISRACSKHTATAKRAGRRCTQATPPAPAPTRSFGFGDDQHHLWRVRRARNMRLHARTGRAAAHERAHSAQGLGRGGAEPASETRYETRRRSRGLIRAVSCGPSGIPGLSREPQMGELARASSERRLFGASSPRPTRGRYLSAGCGATWRTRAG